MQLLIDFVVGITDQRGEAFFPAGRFDSAQHIYGIGVRDIGNNETNQASAPVLEVARHQAGAIIEFGNGMFNSRQQGIRQEMFFTIQIA